jgi:hypothetical protein
MQIPPDVSIIFVTDAKAGFYPTLSKREPEKEGAILSTA